MKYKCMVFPTCHDFQRHAVVRASCNDLGCCGVGVYVVLEGSQLFLYMKRRMEHVWLSQDKSEQMT